MPLLFDFILRNISYVLEIIGVIVISLGALFSISKFFMGCFGWETPITIDCMRLELGRSIVLAVEFLLASDIIKTIITPDYYSIGLLGALVVIRTVLTYFLDLELAELYKQEQPKN